MQSRTQAAFPLTQKTKILSQHRPGPLRLRMSLETQPATSLFSHLFLNVKKCGVNVDDSGAAGAELFLKDAALEVLRGSLSKSVGCGLVSADRKGCYCHLKAEIPFIRVREQNTVTRSLFLSRIFGFSQYPFAL